VKLLGLAGALLLLFSMAAHAATQKLSYAGDSLSTVLAEGSQHVLLTGHAWIQTEDLRITADVVELFGTDYIYAQCRGNVHVVDTKRGLDLTSNELFYDRDKKIARIQGNAVMADVKNEMVVKGGLIEDRDTEQITIVQIGVRIFKKDIECKSEYARYQRDKKILELSGMPWVSKGSDIYQASRITINLDTEDISLEGDVTGSIQTQTKEQPGQAGAASGATESGTAPAGSASTPVPGAAAPSSTPSPAGTSTPAPDTTPAGTTPAPGASASVPSKAQPGTGGFRAK
jgi:lipopolysaccharide export system protein LptA